MIYRLSIKNYAIIDQLDISFSDNLTIITGETGAGKSIILGALGLILGERADTKALFRQEEKCVIEGSFKIGKYELKEFFRENDIDYDPNTIIRREITTDGRSRAFVNDTPVNLTLLRELGEKLIDIHSQHQTLQINSAAFQLFVVDGFAQHAELLLEYKQKFKQYRKLKVKLEEFIEQSNSGKAETDYIQFQYNELESAKLIDDEQHDLEQEQQTLSHAEEIKRNLNHAHYLLNEGEAPIIVQLKEAISVVASLEKLNDQLNAIGERLKSAQIELKDLSGEVEQLAENTIVNPSRLTEVNERLDLIYRLQQKHRLGSIPELIALMNELGTKLNLFNNLDEEIEQLKIQIGQLAKELSVVAVNISKNRNKAIDEVEKEVTFLLKEVGMPNAVFKIDNTLLPEDQFTQTGIDQIRFLFSANQGYQPIDLSKAASGGELSRLMLAIKGLSAQYSALPTIVFDEIDTGVSGEVARKVGNVMHKYAENMQVITITHLPQIASKGQTHFFVYKENKNGQTSTGVRKLNEDERVREIATMLSGENPGENAILNAKELLLTN
ncbi:DNA repair protein RecN [Solitalea koreensis]|uniref:DNA repair protein RecN n=1 Tax=Solitalea koreensis TaxID=543615 RepID=A0A521EID5_9SPHI|nr:DNA repair protein RecN [Solitalea koreensis]SMO83673.1 DNA replication and repair protein RecN [Solitalea koreensis]